MTDLSKMSPDELEKLLADSMSGDIPDSHKPCDAFDIFYELKRRGDVMEKALNDIMHGKHPSGGMQVGMFRLVDAQKMAHEAIKQWRGE